MLWKADCISSLTTTEFHDFIRVTQSPRHHKLEKFGGNKDIMQTLSKFGAYKP